MWEETAEAPAQDSFFDDTNALPETPPVAPAEMPSENPLLAEGPGDAAEMSEAFGHYAELTPEERERQVAADELRGNFEIVGPDHKGPRKPNQITQAELDKMAGMYSDIRGGRSDIEVSDKQFGDHVRWDGTIDEDLKRKNEDCKAKVMGDMAKLMQSPSGRELLSAMHDNEAKGAMDADGNPVHIKTKIGNLLSHHRGANTTDLCDSQGEGGRNMSIYASYDQSKAGSDRDLFKVMAESWHKSRPGGAANETNENRRTYADGTEIPYKDRYAYTLPDKVMGRHGEGSKINGRTITVNQYNRERRAGN